jgi:chitinase
MKRILLVLALVVSGTVLSAPPANAAELAVNGGLETGSLSPWSCTGGLGSVVTSPVRTGSRALQGAASASDNAKCTQTVNGLVSGTSYTLSAWVRGNYVYLGYNGGSSTWTPSAANWTQLSLTFTAAGTSAQIYLHGWYGQGTYHADDISLQGQGGGGGDTTPPSNVSGLTSPSKTSTSVSLSWSAATDNVGVAGYNIYRNGATSPTAQTTGTGTTFNNTGLTPSTAYTYTVKARDAAGNVSSAFSNQISVTTNASGGDSSPPTVPGNFRVTGTTNTSVALAWNASTDNVGVTGYEISRNGSVVTTTSGTTLSYNDTGRTACTTYTYNVRSRDAAGNWSGSSNQISGSTTGCTGGGNKLLGYFVQWGVYQRQYFAKNIHTSGSAAKLTHINYAFGNVTNGQCVIGDAYADYDMAYTAANSVDGVADTWDAGALRGSFNQLRKLKAMYPHLKILWSFGGWTWSGGFGQAAQNPTAFANSCYNLVEDPRWADVFDGIDIDWEYPNACGLTCDTTGFASFRTLSQALRNRFGANYLVTAAITADGTNGGKIDAADYGGAAQYLDWYNVMTYDYFGAFAAQGPTAPHSPLSCYSGIPIAGFCSDVAIAKLKSKGVPSSKLLLGIGFYGRGWTGVTQAAPGGSATGAAPGTYEAGNEDYKVLKTRCPATGTVGGTAYAYCGNQWWSYDTPATIGGKMSWSRSQGLGGSFFWELSGDTTNGELITAMKNGLG